MFCLSSTNIQSLFLYQSHLRSSADNDSDPQILQTSGLILLFGLFQVSSFILHPSLHVHKSYQAAKILYVSGTPYFPCQVDSDAVVVVLPIGV